VTVGVGGCIRNITSAGSTSWIACGDHIQYFNRHFGYVVRPAKAANAHDSYSPGLHHLCFRVDSIADVVSVAKSLRDAGIEASEPTKLYQDYPPDYWATFFTGPDGIRLEVGNYRQERRERHDTWEHFPD
jgi:glyoxylase I family protein